MHPWSPSSCHCHGSSSTLEKSPSTNNQKSVLGCKKRPSSSHRSATSRFPMELTKTELCKKTQLTSFLHALQSFVS